MKKSFLLLSSLCFIFTACENNDRVVAPDNTARNAQPQLTSGDQLENEADRTISQKIRELIVADEMLSTEAKNIKIITRNGVVTLRGVVRTQNEKMDIVKKTRLVSGVNNVEDQLDIVPK